MITSPYQKYQQSSVQTASPAQLILMLYDGAIRFTKQGIEGVETKNFQKANYNFLRAQEVVNELIASLNHDYPIAANLMQIYDYFQRKLMEANVRKSIMPALEVVRLLGELKEAWTEIIKPGSAARDADHG